MPILKNIKRELFSQALAIEQLEPADAYLKAGYTAKDRLTASKKASGLRSVVEVGDRITELLNANLLETKKSSIVSLHSKAVEVAGQLLDSSNEYIRASILKTVLERSEPIVKQSQSIRITVDSKDRDRRSKVLERYKAKSVLIPGTQEGEGEKALPRLPD